MRQSRHFPTQVWTPHICEAIFHNVVKYFQFVLNSKSISPRHSAQGKDKFQIYAEVKVIWHILSTQVKSGGEHLIW